MRPAEKSCGREQRPFSRGIWVCTRSAILRTFRKPGVFARIGAAQSEDFRIDEQAYTGAVGKSISYFSVQRCGDSKTGYHSPCHLDDGKRLDNGAEQDVVGGWHDACDLRKWVDATIYGMIGLSRAIELLGPQQLDASRVEDELRWGNQYFRKMQEPDGYLMNYCGGDDGNRFTDNQRGTDDDRPIHVEPCELPGQFHFIAAQAAMVRLTGKTDAAYAKACSEAGMRCWEWCANHRSPQAANSLGAGITACVQMHRTIGGDKFQDLAREYARRLLSLQVGSTEEVHGFFRTSPDNSEPSRDIQDGNLPLTALCEILEEFPSDGEAGTWRQALELHVEHLMKMAERSAFGTVPYGLYTGGDPGGNRRIGPYWYRWFMKPGGETSDADWWVGINAHLASHGIGLHKAGRLLKDAQGFGGGAATIGLDSGR